MPSYTMRTKASPSKIMAVWKDVPQWKKWDYQLEYSKLNGTFMKGASGIMKSRRGTEAKFVIDDIRKSGLTILVKLPLATLRINRNVSRSPEGCSFMHETSFEGPIGVLYDILFGARFKKELPIVMGKVKKIAES